MASHRVNPAKPVLLGQAHSLIQTILCIAVVEYRNRFTAQQNFDTKNNTGNSLPTHQHQLCRLAWQRRQSLAAFSSRAWVIAAFSAKKREK